MISIIYLTFRQDPKFEWFLDSLWNECKANKFKTKYIQIVFVDSYLWYTNPQTRKDDLKRIMKERFDYVHIPPKPTPYQGPYKLTPVDFFCAANTRNTGVCYAKYDFVMFVDDLSILCPGWFKNVIEAQNANNYVIAGTFRKITNMVVSKGKLISGDITDIDSRAKIYKTDKRVEIPGGHLYGCSFGMPLHMYLAVNGQNELCDTIGGEDYEFGMRLSKAGFKILYNPLLLTYESVNLAETNNSLYRINLSTNRETYFQLLQKYNVDPKKIDHLVYDSVRFFLDVLAHTPTTYAHNNGISLAQLRQDVKNNIPFKLPNITTYFFNNQPLNTLSDLTEQQQQEKNLQQQNELKKQQLYQKINTLIPTMQGWCPPEKAIKIAEIVIASKASLCVELGVFAGRSLMAFALALKYLHQTQQNSPQQNSPQQNSPPTTPTTPIIHGIDAWAKSASLEGTNDKANEDWWSKLNYDEIYNYAKNKMKENEVQDYTNLMKMTSQEASIHFQPNTIDILHQDSNHSEEISTQEVHTWNNKLKQGGYWFFDDTNWETTKKAQHLLEHTYKFKLIEDHNSWRLYKRVGNHP